MLPTSLKHNLIYLCVHIGICVLDTDVKSFFKDWLQIEQACVCVCVLKVCCYGSMFSVPSNTKQTLRRINIGPKLSPVMVNNAYVLSLWTNFTERSVFLSQVYFSEWVSVVQNLNREWQVRFACRQCLQPTIPAGFFLILLILNPLWQELPCVFHPLP